MRVERTLQKSFLLRRMRAGRAQMPVGAPSDLWPALLEWTGISSDKRCVYVPQSPGSSAQQSRQNANMAADASVKPCQMDRSGSFFKVPISSVFYISFLATCKMLLDVLRVKLVIIFWKLHKQNLQRIVLFVVGSASWVEAVCLVCCWCSASGWSQWEYSIPENQMLQNLLSVLTSFI